MLDRKVFWGMQGNRVEYAFLSSPLSSRLLFSYETYERARSSGLPSSLSNLLALCSLIRLISMLQGGQRFSRMPPESIISFKGLRCFDDYSLQIEVKVASEAVTLDCFPSDVAHL